MCTEVVLSLCVIVKICSSGSTKQVIQKRKTKKEEGKKRKGISVNSTGQYKYQNQQDSSCT